MKVKKKLGSKSKLTPKQERYTLNLFKGMYQRQAYIDAYQPTYALAIVDSNASRLAHNEQVVARLQELNSEIVTRTIDNIMSVEQRKERLSALANKDKTPIQAIAELNRMEHIYENATININNLVITPEEYELATRQAKIEEKRLLEGGNNANSRTEERDGQAKEAEAEECHT